MTQKQTQVVKINIYNDKRVKSRQNSKPKPYSGTGGGGGAVNLAQGDNVGTQIARNYLRQLENANTQKFNPLLENDLTQKLNYFGAKFLQSADNRYMLKNNLFNDDAGNFAGNNYPKMESQRTRTFITYPEEDIGISSRNISPNPYNSQFDTQDNYSMYSQPSYITNASNPMFPMEYEGNISLELPEDMLQYVENTYIGSKRRARDFDIQLYHYLTNTPYSEIENLKIDFIRRKNTKILRDNGLM